MPGDRQPSLFAQPEGPLVERIRSILRGQPMTTAELAAALRMPAADLAPMLARLDPYTVARRGDRWSVTDG